MGLAPFVVIQATPRSTDCCLGEARSIVVREVVVFVPCLDAVVLVAERLPVALIPEQPLVTTVWYDVVNVCCLDVLAFLHALHTQGMRCEVTLTRLLPRLAVASTVCRPLLFRMK